MIVAIVVLSVSSLLAFAAIDAVNGDVQLTRNDLDQSRALLAADAGLAAFRQQLNLNANYWNTCPGANGATGVTGITSATGATVPGSTDGGSTEHYTYRDLPATTAPSTDSHCDTSDPDATIIEGNSAGSGSFRVEVMGTSGKVSRTIVAQFRPQSFLNYVYFTDYETPDPLVTGGTCESTYGNGNEVYYWASPSPTTGASRNTTCGTIDFITGDDIAGPLHSNDDLFISGSPTFGRSAADDIDVPGFYTSSGVAATTTCTGCNLKGTWTFGGTIQPPSDDSALLQIADGNNSSLNGCSTTGAGCLFTGPTTIVLNDTVTTANTMTVTNNSLSPTTQTLNFPTNGVIYVQNGSGTCAPYSASSPAYPTSGACGNATVSGNYTQSLTIAAANDVIVNGSITTPLSNGEPSDNSLLGLIATDFVRVAHPCSGGTNGSADNGLYTSMSSPTIDAAILAVSNSFLVDSWNCGAPLGTLTVNGAIAQEFRGAVGTSSNNVVATGYLKTYNYEGVLETESPPYFLNPIGSAWQLVRVTECGTAC